MKLNRNDIYLCTHLQCLVVPPGGALTPNSSAPSNMAPPLPASAAASLGGTALHRGGELPGVGHFRRAQVSFDSAFKVSCRELSRRSSSTAATENTPLCSKQDDGTKRLFELR